MVGAGADGGVDVTAQLGARVDDLHGAPAQHIRGAHEARIADAIADLEGLVAGAGDTVGGAADGKLVEQLAEPPAVLGQVDGVLGRTQDGDAGSLELVGDAQRRLAAELDDHAFGPLVGADVGHVFEGERLEVEAVGDVVVGRDGLGVAVHHDGVVAVLAHGHGGVHAAVVELDPLADAVGPAAEDDDALALAGQGLVLVLVGRVEVGRLGFELGGAGVDRLVDRHDAEPRGGRRGSRPRSSP